MVFIPQKKKKNDILLRGEEFPKINGAIVNNRRESYTDNLEEWFEKNKFKSKSFSNINRLLEYKKEKKQTISLVIPTLNEEDTIENTINTLKSRLMDKYPLIDEILVVDSGSTDKTRELAIKSGANFYSALEILKRYSSAKGKGENLWKSLCVTNGSIIVFIDADIKNIHPRLVYGLVGPLLTNNKIGYTKAFYRYYKSEEETEKTRGWGRMTELLIRPLINLFFPQLSGIIQPSSGQFAGRREVLEKIPFFTGYGVELGLLIDIQKRFGLSKIAQVDLVKVNHRHRDASYKGVMAFGILQVFSKRANELGKLILFRNIRKIYRTFEVCEDGKLTDYRLKKIIVSEKERPPMITIGSYRKKYKKEPSWILTEKKRV